MKACEKLQILFTRLDLQNKKKGEDIMNITFKSKLVICVLLVMIVGLFVPIPQARPSGPSLVRLTGTFYSPEEKGANHSSGMHTFTAFIQGKEWIFDVKGARTLTGDRFACDILRVIFPPSLNFRGPETIIGPLKKPEIVGQSVTVEGYIYVPNGIVQVSAIKVN